MTDPDDLESRDILQDFRGRRWEDIPGKVIEHNYCSLPFLTTEAYCYYLPAYLVYAVKSVDSSGLVNMFAIFSLATRGPELRTARRMMTPAERAAIRAYLEFVAARDEHDPDLAERAADALHDNLWG